MKNILLALLFINLGFFAVIGWQYFQNQKSSQVLEAPMTAPTPATTPFVLRPPSQALNGTLSIIKGKIELKSRDTGVYAEASSGAQILTGETIASGENTAATITIDGFATSTLEENSELVFANLYPTNMVLQQKNGKVTYRLVDQQYPVSVRVLHTLVSLLPGTTTINIIDTDISVSVASGSAAIALVDTDNNTHVWKLEKNEQANIDDAKRHVYLIRPR